MIDGYSKRLANLRNSTSKTTKINFLKLQSEKKEDAVIKGDYLLGNFIKKETSKVIVWIMKETKKSKRINMCVKDRQL
jgi:hypothetical protein